MATVGGAGAWRRSRRRACGTAAVALAILLLELPGAALAAATNPLSGGVSPVAPITTTTSAPTAVATNAATNTSGNSTLSSSSALVIVIGAAVVIGGIALFIWRDARRRAPVRGRREEAALGDGRRTGSKPPPKPRKLSTAERKRRKRGKAR
ncbi:MAG TPA: hypothetical protein VIK04_05390 [Solirubrobacteraceae bacterium]